jgi:hypothetical protein
MQSSSLLPVSASTEFATDDFPDPGRPRITGRSKNYPKVLCF